MSDAFMDWARVARERDAALAEVTRLRRALACVRSAVELAPEDILADTLWMLEEDGVNETVVDFIDAALQGDGT